MSLEDRLKTQLTNQVDSQSGTLSSLIWLLLLLLLFIYLQIPSAVIKAGHIAVSVRKVSHIVGFDGIPPFVTKGRCHIAARLLYTRAD
jgi:hypothetical protein